MTRLRSRPSPPAAASPAGGGCRTSSSAAGQKQPAAVKARPKPAEKPKTGPVDRLRPNLFISPVIGRARARVARKAEPVKPAAQSTATADRKTPDKTRTEKKRAIGAAKGAAQAPAATQCEKAPSQTRVASKRGTEAAAKPAAASGGKRPSQARDKKGGSGTVKSATQTAAAPAVKTPSRTRAKRERETDAAQPNTKAADAPAEKTPRRTQVSKGRATKPTAQPAEPAPVSKGKTPSRTGPKTGSATDASQSQAVPTSKTPSRGKRSATQAAATRNGDLSKDHTSKLPAVASKRAASTVGGNQARTVSAPAGSHAVTSKSTSSHAAATSKQSSGHHTKPAARASKPTTASRVSPLKRPLTVVPSAPPGRPAGPVVSTTAAATATATATATAETPSKRPRLSGMSPKAVPSRQQEAAASPSRFTAILPRPPLPPPPGITASAPLPPSAAVTEPLAAVATPRRHRLPRHVTSTPCGPPAPPPAADSAETCYGFMDDIEPEDEEEESVPLEQMVSPVGVGRARLPPPPAARLRDATNLPSRFNAGRLVRKAAGERSEVTTTVASQLMDPEVTFSKPASRSYSRRRTRDPSSGGGLSTFGHSTLGSETSAAAGGDVTGAKHSRHYRKKRDEELEQAEMERWAAFANSRLSEVNSFELVVERA